MTKIEKNYLEKIFKINFLFKKNHNLFNDNQKYIIYKLDVDFIKNILLLVDNNVNKVFLDIILKLKKKRIEKDILLKKNDNQKIGDYLKKEIIKEINKNLVI